LGARCRTRPRPGPARGHLLPGADAVGAAAIAAHSYIRLLAGTLLSGIYNRGRP